MNLSAASNRGLIRLARRTLGFLCLIIWAIGAILPIIPGWPALILAVVLLGRRDRTLRLMHLLCRRSLRWLRTHPRPRVSSVGRWLSDQYLGARRTLTPLILNAERSMGGA